MKATIFALLVLLCPVALLADPWVYEPGEQSLTVFYVSESFDDIWIMGDDVHNTDFPQVDQTTLWVQYNRGLTHNITLNATAGFTQSEWAGSDYEYDGLADSKVGINWQLMNEYQGSPVTLSVAFAGTIKGTYERSAPGRPHGSGDKANALESSVSVARSLGRIVTVGEFGYRARFNDVPDEFFYSVGLMGSVTPSLSLGGRYQGVDSRGDLDIGGVGFTGNFHETAEDYDGFSFDATWNFGFGHSVNAGVAGVLSGKNTGNSDVYFLGYSYGF
jgi:hypothetical protein